MAATQLGRMAGGAETAAAGGGGFTVPTVQAGEAARGFISEAQNVLRFALQNPLVAAFAVPEGARRLQRALGGNIDKLKEQAKVLKRTRPELAGYIDQQIKMADRVGNVTSKVSIFASGLGALGIRLANTREQMRRLSGEVHQFARLADMPGGAVDTMTHIERQRIRQIRRFGSQFADQYGRTFRTLYSQISEASDEMSTEERDRFIETVAVMTQATGVDFANMINRLTTEYRSYGMGAREAFAWTAMVQQSWADANLTAEDLTENMTNIFNIARSLQQQGLRPDIAMGRALQFSEAMAAGGFGVQETQQMSALLSRTLGGDINLFESLRAFTAMHGVDVPTDRREFAERLHGMSGAEIISMYREILTGVFRQHGITDPEVMASPTLALGRSPGAVGAVQAFAQQLGVDETTLWRLMQEDMEGILEEAADSARPLDEVLQEWESSIDDAAEGAKSFNRQLYETLRAATTISDQIRGVTGELEQWAAHDLGVGEGAQRAIGVAGIGLGMAAEMLPWLMISRALRRGRGGGMTMRPLTRGTGDLLRPGAQRQALAGGATGAGAGRWLTRGGFAAPALMGGMTAVEGMRDPEMGTGEAWGRGGLQTALGLGGAWAGGWAGAKMGATLGTFAGPIGTLVGGVGGALAGALLSDAVFGERGEREAVFGDPTSQVEERRRTGRRGDSTLSVVIEQDHPRREIGREEFDAEDLFEKQETRRIRAYINTGAVRGA